MTENNPFCPGARVAIQDDGGYSAPLSYRPALVDKVYKSGRFTLQGSPQQWRPHEPSRHSPHWRASQTGDHGWHRSASLRIWDEDSDAEISAAIEKRNKYNKFVDLQRKIERLRFNEKISDDVLQRMQEVAEATSTGSAG